MTAAAFSTNETDFLQRSLETEDDDPPVELEEIWSDQQQKICSGWIRQNSYKRICLQFPDNYLPHSNAVSDSLKALLAGYEAKVFILADTSYGSCCVDEVAAAHVDADSMIHFGNACRAKVSRLPVLYVFPQLPFDLPKFLAELETVKIDCQNKPVYVYLDMGYHHLLEYRKHNEEEESLTSKLKCILTDCGDVHLEVYPPGEDVRPENDESDEQRVCIFVGGDNRRFFNVSLTTKAAQWYIYDVASETLAPKNPLTTNYIRRRYFYIEKCKDAQTLGLLVATLSTDGYLDIVTRLKEMAKSHGIKTQIISVGRINPAKLANFLEIDCFVLIGCMYNNMYNTKEFYKPIVSVFEAEMALNPAWHMKYPETYVTDFKQLLPEGRSFLPFIPEEIAAHDVSLVSGRMRNAAVADGSADGANVLSEQEQSVVGPGKMEVMTTTTGLTFEDRTWKGLDPALGRSEPAQLQKGLSGIPIKYTHD